jgi:hypothetical protein
MASRDAIAERLGRMADQELDSATRWVDRLEGTAQVVLLIEASRVMDYHHVQQVFSKTDAKLSVPDFDIMVRGWNPALGHLLPQAGLLNGFPLHESTVETRSSAMTYLHQLGRFTLLRQAADMVRYGLADGELVDERIVLRMSDRTATDHFLDRLDKDRLRRLHDGPNPVDALIDETAVDDLDGRLAALVFPWSTVRGNMIAYGAAPDIDGYFLALATRETMDWKSEAGIHPNVNIEGVSGKHLAAIGLLLTSFYLKHIRFVSVGMKKIPNVNPFMSLTIWKPAADLRTSIAEFTGISIQEVDDTLTLLTAKRGQHDYFRNEPTPFVPMLIQISEQYVLSPVSSIFRNPFQGVRMLQERRFSGIQEAIQTHREGWMISEICHLFQGNRYRIVDQPARLNRGDKTVTDIDAAVFDRTTGTLALFQLKWQDFDSNDVRRQRSKAKNFVEQVDAWARETQGWTNEYGAVALCQTLRLKLDEGRGVSAILMFAIGRSAARFQSYGYIGQSKDVGICVWPQFVRLRHEIGPADDVFRSLYERIQSESQRPINSKPLPHEIAAAGHRVLFEDLWRLHDDQS